MQWRTLGGMAVVTTVSLAIVGIVSNFVLAGISDITRANHLLVSPKYQIAALMSLGLILGSLVVFGALGRPWRAWSRTPYW